MSRKKSVAELEAAAQAAEKRAKELRARVREATQAEEARIGAEVLRAVDAWRVTERPPLSREEAVGWLLRRADANRRPAAPMAMQGGSETRDGIHHEEPATPSAP